MKGEDRLGKSWKNKEKITLLFKKKMFEHSEELLQWRGAGGSLLGVDLRANAGRGSEG